jgi:small subunit ribosomal protein S19
MTRAIWKGIYLGSKDYIFKGGVVYNRKLLININDVGKVVYVYNGMKKVKVVIEEGMVGHNFGEFALTRKMSKNIHNTKKKKKNILKRK